MSVITKGSFSLDFGIFKMETELTDDDRQCAWELYTEIVTRVAVMGKTRDAYCSDFSGEVFAESLDSLHAFFVEARSLMRRFPVGHLGRGREHHLGVLINDATSNVLRPFLETWQADYRYWWKTQTVASESPLSVQKHYPKYQALLDDWRDVRLLMRELAGELVRHYQLVEVNRVRRLLGEQSPQQ